MKFVGLTMTFRHECMFRDTALLGQLRSYPPCHHEVVDDVKLLTDSIRNHS